MNKIVIVNDEIIEQQIDNTIKIVTETETKFLNVNTLKIKVNKNTNLVIEYTNTKDVKLDLYISIEPNVVCNLFEHKNGGTYKLGYKYYLSENSQINIEKLNNVQSIKELIIINLNGENAKANYRLKTISNNEEKYDLMVYHNASKTESHINNNGVNIQNGILNFNVSGFVPKDKIDCILNQENRIINLTSNNCTIKPNLFIDENDVIANHSAHIGNCNAEEIFYLMSRGITEKKAEYLLIKGFLLKGLTYFDKEMEKIINRYWR